MANDDSDNVVHLNVTRAQKDLEEVPELEMAIYVAMSQNNCTIQFEHSERTMIDMEDPETIRRVCQALNTTLHMFMRKFKLRTLKPQRKRLRRVTE